MTSIRTRSQSEQIAQPKPHGATETQADLEKIAATDRLGVMSDPGHAFQ